MHRVSPGDASQHPPHGQACASKHLEHLEAVVFHHDCKEGAEGDVSKRLDSPARFTGPADELFPFRARNHLVGTFSKVTHLPRKRVAETWGGASFSPICLGCCAKAGAVS